MLRSNGRRAVILAAIAGLGLAGTAQAATKTVQAGLPPASQKQFNQELSSDVSAYFPSKIAINVGDSVEFVPVGFHNVELVKKGAKPSGLLAAAGKASGEKDAAGADFWFNGQDIFGFNPALLNSKWGKSATFDGKTTVESGLPLADKPKPFTVNFRKKGSWAYYCAVHPGMKGSVKVLAKNAKAPSKKSDAKRVKKQLASALATAKRIVKADVPANTVKVGASGPGGVEYFGFLPEKLTVAKGTTVSFAMPTKSTEIHTATTGPGNPDKEQDSYLGKVAAGFNAPAIPGTAFYSSEPPTSVAQLTKTLHGNGFWNSGVLDGGSAVPLPSQNSVVFAEAGTYDFYCLVHTFMHGQVTVQ